MTAASALDTHRDDGALVARLPRLTTVSTPWVGATWTTVAVMAAAAVAGSSGAVVALGLVGVLLALVAVRARPAGRYAWLVPPTLRLLEYAVVIAVATTVADRAALPAAVAALAAVITHHYEAVYRRATLGRGPDRVVVWLLGGWEGRTLVVLLAALVGAVVPLLWGLAAWCGALTVAESTRAWWSATSTDRRKP